MTNKSSKEEVKIKSLLEAYSISEISNTFTQIDNKLLSLHKCSADDFLQLNSDFKNLFKQSKSIADNVSVIVDLFKSNKSKEFYNEVHLFYDKLKNEASVFDEKISLTMNFLDDLADKLRYIFFPLRNFNQNLMSFKYLLANLNLSLNISDGSSNMSKQFKAIEENINDLKLLTEKITKTLNHLRKTSKSINSSFLQIKNQHEDSIDVLLSNVKNRISDIEKKYISNKECIPKIQKRTDKSSESISHIIKKLQYQDIIQQKMEHIQQTHKDLLAELNQYENTLEDDQHLNDKAKFFIRIRDIAGLQAAQLIQANKEYQSALEIIVNNFMQVGDNMKAISGMCDVIHTDKGQDEVKLFDEIIDQITLTENNFENRINQNMKLKNDVLIVERKLEQSDNYIKALKRITGELNANIKHYFDSANIELSKYNNSSDSINQVKNLHAEIEANVLNLESVIEDLNPIRKRIKKITKEYSSPNFDANFDEVKESVSSLYTFRKSIEGKLKENHEISNKALVNIKKSIAEIKYYDYFENIIEEIIKELNTINYKLKIGDDDSESIEENLATIKEYYTMETEHKIHDQISKGEEIEIENEEDGDIEFF